MISTKKDLYSVPRFTGRSIALLIAGTIGGAAVLAPAVGSAAAFLTKTKADKRYLGNTTVVTASATTQGSAQPATVVQVSCPSGRQATGGGLDSPVFTTGSGDAVITLESRPITTGTKSTGWYAEVAASDPFPVTAYAVCVP